MADSKKEKICKNEKSCNFNTWEEFQAWTRSIPKRDRPMQLHHIVSFFPRQSNDDYPPSQVAQTVDNSEMLGYPLYVKVGSDKSFFSVYFCAFFCESEVLSALIALKQPEIILAKNESSESVELRFPVSEMSYVCQLISTLKLSPML